MMLQLHRIWRGDACRCAMSVVVEYIVFPASVFFKNYLEHVS